MEATILHAPDDPSLRTTGGFWGGNKVNDAFMQIWIEIFGNVYNLPGLYHLQDLIACFPTKIRIHSVPYSLS